MPATEDTNFIAPDNKDEKLWRYMDFAKFVSMISTGSLWFSRPDKFDDPFEGSRPNYYVNERNTVVVEQYRAQYPDMPVEELKQIVEATFNRDLSIRNQYFYINCWHMNDCESEAMWRLYGERNGAIAIQSTYRRLFNCLPPECKVGKVFYRANDPNEATDEQTKNIFLLKRKAFDHEREVRAITHGEEQRSDNNIVLPNTKAGLAVQVNLSELIEAIVIAPTADRWYIDAVQSVAKKYDLKIEPEKSVLTAIPRY